MWAIKSGPSQVKTDRRGESVWNRLRNRKIIFISGKEPVWRISAGESGWLPCQVSDICPVRRVETFHYSAEELGIWSATCLPQYMCTGKLARPRLLSASQSWVSISQGNTQKKFFVVHGQSASEESRLPTWVWGWTHKLPAHICTRIVRCSHETMPK